MLGSHLPIGRKLLGGFAALLQSPIKWYNEKKSCLDLLDGYIDLGHALTQMKVERSVSVIIPWRCQPAPAAQKAQTPVLVNLPWTSPACCNLELQASGAYPCAVAHFSKTQGWSLCPLGGHTNTWHKLQKKVELFIWVVLPLTSLAVTITGSSVVGRDVIWLPYFQSCSQCQM